MTVRLFFISFGLAASLWAVPAVACSVAQPDWNKRVKHSDTCSFYYAGANDMGAGKDAVDQGNGLVSQELSFFFASGMAVVDCTSATSAIVWAKNPPQDEQTSCGETLPISAHLPPTGALDVSGIGSVAGLVQFAATNGFRTTADANDLNKNQRRKDRFDAFCGCKLHYPESAGAKK
ncbi:hypothetical protein [Ascidiaceihabitans sp.]|uniref:hypothetical protein n=1 Tax=Ascidiaceihabitans sp. TaxID=1872644 RepID=UPI0032989F9B